MFDHALPSFHERPEEGSSTSGERYALVVALEVDRCRVSLFILMMAFLGFAIGAGVCIVTGDLGLGAEVGGAFLGLVTVLEGVMFLMYSSTDGRSQW